MTTKHEVPQNPARETVEEARAAKRSSVFAIARRLVSLRVVALFGLAAIAGAMVAMGCGSSGSVGAQSDATQKPVAVQTSNGVGPTVMPAASERVVPAGDGALKKVDEDASLPPDVALATLDSLVTPGQQLDIVVEGTKDVTGVVLSDGLTSPEAFTLDEKTQLWHAAYRVPLRPTSERLGLSVTARNDSNRWRRVWTFLHVVDPMDGDQGSAAEPDSTTEQH